MSKKRVPISIRPRERGAQEDKTHDAADNWVKRRDEQNKRLTLDIPVRLHTAIKMGCAARQTKMVDEIRALLEREYQTKRTG